MRHPTVRLVAAIVLVVGFDLSQSVFASGGDAVTEGRTLYQQFCKRCHGHELGSTGASTFDLRKFPKGDKDRFVVSVSEGLNSMPPHGDILSAAEIEALYDYVMVTLEQN